MAIERNVWQTDPAHAGDPVSPVTPAGDQARPAPVAYDALSKAAFNLLVLLILMTLLNVPNRLPWVGYARPTLWLVGLITLLILLSRNQRQPITPTATSRLLMVLVGYVFVAIPFAEWPGSALNTGIDKFLSAVVFFFFPFYLVETPRQLRRIVLVFTGCQMFRALEPLYLHLTTGYWGSAAHMGNGEFMDRLSGAPCDIVNPNGLAFVIMTTIPFLHYIFGGDRRPAYKAVYAILLPLLLFALILTGSRSGIIGLVVIYAFVILRSKHQVAMILAAAIVMIAMFMMMDDNTKDRYLSIVSGNTKNSATSEDRINGTFENFKVGMRRPIFGHGIGTSREANGHFFGGDQMSHDLYAEVFIELGAIGLVIYLGVLYSIVRSVLEVRPAGRRIWLLARSRGSTSKALRNRLLFYHRCAEAIFVFSIMCMVFSLASYGLSEFYWYLTAGISVSLINVMRADSRALMSIPQPAASG